MRSSIKGCGDGFGAGVGTFDQAFQRRGKIGRGPGARQKEIGDGCFRQGPMGSSPPGAWKEEAGLPKSLGLTGFLSMCWRKVEKFLYADPSRMNEPFFGVFLGDRFT